MTCTQHMVLYMVLWTRSICVIYNVSCNNVLDIIIVYTNNQWTLGDVLEDYDYTKVKEYLPILDEHGYFREGYFTTKDQLQQQSLAHQQQLLQLQQHLDTERRMRRSMALQLDKLQESSANISTGNILRSRYSVYYFNIGDVGTKEVTMTDIAIQCTIYNDASGNVHVITVQSIIFTTFIYATCTCTFTLTVSIQLRHFTDMYVIYCIL